MSAIEKVLDNLSNKNIGSLGEFIEWNFLIEWKFWIIFRMRAFNWALEKFFLFIKWELIIEFWEICQIKAFNQSSEDFIEW